MNVSAGFSPAARSLIISAAVAVVIIFMKFSAEVLGPVLLAIFIAIVIIPVLEWMRRKGVPKYLGMALVLFVLFDVGSLFAIVTTGALDDLRESLPTYQQRLTVLGEAFGAWLESLGFENSREAVPDLINPAAAARLVSALLANVSGTFGTGLLVLLAVVFMLIEAPGLRTKLQVAFNLSEETKERLTRVLQAATRYMAIKSLTSIATGVCIYAWLLFLGVDFAVLWGAVAVLLNFIPFIGSVMMAIPGVLMALVQTDLQTTLLVILGYVVVNTAIGNIIEPRIMGHELGMSALAVFLSLLFWGWVLGTIGVFLSVPLTMALLVALDANPRTRPIAILLGSDTRKPDP